MNLNTKARRLATATARVRHYEARAAVLDEQRRAMLAKAAEWQRVAKWFADMPTTDTVPTTDTTDPEEEAPA